MQTYDQPTPQPTNKVAASGVGGAFAIVLIWILGNFGVQMPAEVAAAITLILGTGAAYLTRERVAS